MGRAERPGRGALHWSLARADPGGGGRGAESPCFEHLGKR